ncbi:BOB1 [Scenedesmus sp. PABB004]|nr:BOB1 [Scenedesmus sp. PABB004]
MACAIEELPFDPTEFDRELGRLLLGHEGDVGAFLGSVFDFLARKTNFFKGPDAKRRVLDAYRAVAGEGEPGFKAGFLGGGRPGAKASPAPQAPGGQAGGSDAAAAPAAPAVPAAAAAAPPAAAQASPSGAAAPAAAAAAQEPAPEAGPSKDAPELGAEQSDQGAKGLSARRGAPAAAPARRAGPATAAPHLYRPAAAAAAAVTAATEPNDGRGADLGRYSWTQTLGEVAVCVPVGREVKAKQLHVDMRRQALRVGVRGQPPILDGALAEGIKPDDCMWNLADGVVELTLTKAEGMHWWSRVMADDPAIDVQAVEPESSKLTDLDPETRQTVEKMMFDQRQKALGLPTSEELNKQEMLKRFMAAHPEMDFSGAKIISMGWITFVATQTFVTVVTLGAMKRQGIIQLNTANIKNDTARYCMVKLVDFGEDVCIFSEKFVAGLKDEIDKAKKERK